MRLKMETCLSGWMNKTFAMGLALILVAILWVVQNHHAYIVLNYLCTYLYVNVSTMLLWWCCCGAGQEHSFQTFGALETSNQQNQSGGNMVHCIRGGQHTATYRVEMTVPYCCRNINGWVCFSFSVVSQANENSQCGFGDVFLWFWKTCSSSMRRNHITRHWNRFTVNQLRAY